MNELMTKMTIDHTPNSATSLQRLIHFIIDLTIWLALYLAVAFLLDQYLSFSSYTVNYIYSISLGLVLFLGYYCLLEYYFQRTLGKLLTGTKVADVGGDKIGFKTIFIRTISRLIPIDIFYYLFSKTGLHDRLSATLVVKSSEA